jgi:ankyrin repeat protein
MEQTPQEKINEKFLQAAAEGNIEKAIECLTEGADLNAKTLKGNNALYLAGTRNRKEFFDWILEVTQKGNPIDVNNINNVNDTLLFELVREKVNVHYVDALLNKNASVDMPSRSGGTALLQACANTDYDVVKCLVEHKANPNAFLAENKTTPMLMAAAEGNFDILKLLAENGGNLNELDKTGKNILLNALFRPMTYMKKDQKKAHNEMITYLVDSNVDLDYVAPSGVSAIWLAAYTGKDDIVKKLLEKNVVVDRWHELTPSKGKLSVTHILCRQDKPEVLEQILKMGGKLSIPDESGNLPESYGFQNPKLREILLAHNADVNAVLYVNDSDPNMPKKPIPLFPNIVAEGDSKFPIIEEMVKRGVKTSYENKDWDQFDPLLAAITSSSPLTTELLLKQPGFNPNKLLNLNPNGLEEESYSYLSIACANMNSSKLAGAMEQKKHFETLLNAQKENEKNGVQSEILNKDAFALIQKGFDDLTKVEDTILENRKKIFNALIESGSDIELSNEKGRTALFYCKDVHHAYWLQEANANIFHKDNTGNTAFTHAIINGNAPLIDFYKNQYKLTQNLDNIYYRMAFEEIETFSQQQQLEQGILHFAGGAEIREAIYPKKKEDFVRQNVDKIDYQDNDGNTALLVACANDMPFLVSLYYKLGADVNARNNLGETPIMHAIATKNAQLVEFLVEKGADCSAQTNDGKSVLDFALETGKLPILKAVKEIKTDADVVVAKKPRP